jgi:hypothetical protein
MLFDIKCTYHDSVFTVIIIRDEDFELIKRLIPVHMNISKSLDEIVMLGNSEESKLVLDLFGFSDEYVDYYKILAK